MRGVQVRARQVVTALPPSRRHRRLRVPILLIVTVAGTVAAAVVRSHEPATRSGETYLSTHGWPPHGQAAYQLGDARPAASRREKPVPIASLAKVMTAYVVLQHDPLHGNEPGRSFVVHEADVADTAERRQQGQSVVEVRSGEELTERDALMAVLLPSANNVAVLLAREVAGSVPAFVTEMNATADQLGMAHTIYTDPSGYDPGTVSTAKDQLRLARVSARNPTLAALMATTSYRLPVAGVVTNTDSLLGRDGFVGMKTGSDQAAGGCFMFRSQREVGGRTVDLVGVVLGQHGRDLIAAGLDAAQRLADQLAPIAAPVHVPAGAGRTPVDPPAGSAP